MGAAGKHLSSDIYHQCHGLVVDTGFDLMAGLNNLGGLFQLQWFYDQLHLSCEAWWWRSQCKGYNAVCLTLWNGTWVSFATPGNGNNAGYT